MKARVYLRISKDGKILANDKPNHQPITRMGNPVPTAAFALDLDIPDSRFKMAEQVLAEVKVMEEGVTIAADVVYKK